MYNSDPSDQNNNYFRILMGFFSVEIRVTSTDVYTEMGGTTTQEYLKLSVRSPMSNHARHYRPEDRDFSVSARRQGALSPSNFKTPVLLF